MAEKYITEEQRAGCRKVADAFAELYELTDVVAVSYTHLPRFCGRTAGAHAERGKAVRLLCGVLSAVKQGSTDHRGDFP